MERNSVLKLFGVELDPSPLHERDESASSLSPPSTVGKPSPPPPAAKKFKCSNCFKIFANPQALGGHQNAHKKEKMRRKTMQLQARKASCLNYYYINPFFNNYDQSFSNLNKEVQISFGSNNLDKNDYEYKVRCNNNNYYYVSVQENNKRRFIVRSSSSSPESKRICSRKGLDLHLGLGL